MLTEHFAPYNHVEAQAIEDALINADALLKLASETDKDLTDSQREAVAVLLDEIWATKGRYAEQLERLDVDPQYLTMRRTLSPDEYSAASKITAEYGKPIPDKAVAAAARTLSTDKKALRAWIALPAFCTELKAMSDARTWTHQLGQAVAKIPALSPAVLSLHRDNARVVKAELVRGIWEKIADVVTGGESWPPDLLRVLKSALLDAGSQQPNKGKPGRRGYPIEAWWYATKLRDQHPSMKAHVLRQRCLDKFSEDDLPPDPESFRRWLNRKRADKRANRAN